MTAWWLTVALAATTSSRPVHEYRLEVRSNGELWASTSVTSEVKDASKLTPLSANGTDVFVIRGTQRTRIVTDAKDQLDFSGVRDGDRLVFYPPLAKRESKSPWPQLSLPGLYDDVVFGQTVRITASWPRALGCRLLGPEGKLVPAITTGDSAKVTLEFVHDRAHSAAFSCVPSWDAVRQKLAVAPQLPADLAKAISERRVGSIIQRVDEIRGAVSTLKLEPDVLASTFVEALRLGGVEATLVNVGNNSGQLAEELPLLITSPSPTVFVGGVSEWFEVSTTIDPLCSDRLLNRVGVAMKGAKPVLRTGGGKSDCATFTSEAKVTWSDTGAATWTEQVAATGPCRNVFFLSGVAARRRETLGAFTVTRDENFAFTLTDIPSLTPGTSRAVVPQLSLERACDIDPIDTRIDTPRGDQLELGSPRTLRSTVTIELPAGFDIDTAETLTGEAPGLRWLRSVSREERRVVVVRSLSITRSLAPLKDQADLERAWTAWNSLPPLKLEDAHVIAARRDGVTRVTEPLEVSRIATWAGLPDLSIASARAATKKDPRSPDAWRQLVEALRLDSLGRASKQNRDEQLRAIDTLLKLAPHDIDARLRWLELHDAPSLVTPEAVRRVVNDTHFKDVRALQFAASWWLLSNVHLQDVKWPADVVASVETLQRQHSFTLTDEQRRRLRRYEELEETPLQRHETKRFDAKNAVDVASEVLAHRFGLLTRVPSAKVGVSAKLQRPRGELNDFGLDVLRAGDVEESARGTSERWVCFGAANATGFVVLLQKNSDDTWRASPQQEPDKTLAVIATALDGNDEAKLRDALQLLVASRAARMPNVATTPGPIVVKALLNALGEMPPPSPSFRARVQRWNHFGEEVRREIAWLQHAWGWPEDARVTAEPDADLRFDFAQLRGDFALAATVKRTGDDVSATANALRLGDASGWKKTRELVRAKKTGRERALDLNNLAWAAVFSSETLWPEALVDAREAAELSPDVNIIGTRVVLEALVGAPTNFSAALDSFWAARPPATMEFQFVTFALAAQAERLGFTDEARRLYGNVKPLVPADAINDLAPLAKKRLKR